MVEVIDIESSTNDKVGDITLDNNVIEIVSDLDEIPNAEEPQRRNYPSSPNKQYTRASVEDVNSSVQRVSVSIELDGQFQRDTSINDSEINTSDLKASYSTRSHPLEVMSVNEDSNTFTPPKVPPRKMVRKMFVDNKYHIDTATKNKKRNSSKSPTDILSNILSDSEDNTSSIDTPGNSSTYNPDTLAVLTSKWACSGNSKTSKSGTPYSTSLYSSKPLPVNTENVRSYLRRTLANSNNVVVSDAIDEFSSHALISSALPPEELSSERPSAATKRTREGSSVRSEPEGSTSTSLRGSKTLSCDKNPEQRINDIVSLTEVQNFRNEINEKSGTPSEGGTIVEFLELSQDEGISTPKKQKSPSYESIDPDSSFISGALNNSTETKNVVDSNEQATQFSDKIYIVHSEHFSDAESQSMIGRIISNAKLKKRFNEANKASRNKDILLAELVLSINDDVYKYFSSEQVHIKEVLSPAQVFQNYEDLPIIRFKRNCTTIYDLNHNLFYPCDSVLCEETTCVLFYKAIDFFYQYRTQKNYFLRRIRSLAKSGKKVIIALNDYNRLEKSITHLENKHLRERVEEQLNGNLTSPKRKSAKEVKLEELDMKAKDLDRKLNEITIHADVDIFPINSTLDFMNWLNNLVLVVAKHRYHSTVKNMNWAHINVKIGKTPTEVLSKALQQVNNVTQCKADRITNVYPSFQKLFADFRKGYLVSGRDGNPLMTKLAEKAIYALCMSDNPEEKIYFD
ncbi:Mms4p Ecym_3485 [Eremothecium cymbalariae DBVPG|uniref:ERCC4 domain-containing protein n=1 Tax=Eremothecium cymbalariae (strain CBS 270.75 / DBVPG 7215 / KCTC 17166 / NRRL Y-17582) TaxID=931890 RepID=G8JS49_ERECY|nr:Hypothetical protein Ecym_3485 [Eremothecium cymbalariae DBVPG\